MFFVGATGQLLTLILTVGLPFVFLFSGHQKIEIQNPSSKLQIQQEKQKIVIDTSISFEEAFNLVFEQQKINIGIKFVRLKKNLPGNSIKKHKRFLANYSENKAPPSVVYFL